MCKVLLNISESQLICLDEYTLRLYDMNLTFRLAKRMLASKQCVTRTTMLPITFHNANMKLSRKHNYFIFTFYFKHESTTAFEVLENAYGRNEEESKTEDGQ